MSEPETPEEAHDRLMKNYKNVITINLEAWRNNKQDTTTQVNIINETDAAYWGMQEFTHAWIQKQENKVCKFIETENDVITVICEAAMTSASSEFVKNALSVIGNLAYSSRELSKIICLVPGFLKKLYDICEKNTNSSSNLDDNLKQLISTVLSIVYNVAMADTNIPILQELKFAPILMNYLTFQNKGIQLVALLALADIMNEDESHYVESNDATIALLIKLFSTSVTSTSRTATDNDDTFWCVLALGKGIGNLARIDGIKKLLVDKGSLPLLLKMAKSDDLEEQKEALKSIWALAFDEENQDKIIQEPGLIEFIDNKNRTGVPNTRLTCNGILWTMRTKLSKSKKFKAIGERLNVNEHKAEFEKSKNKGGDKGHVMISYQWNDQELLKSIRDKVRGLCVKVWMDIDDMEGSTLQGMANAVENAEIVLICMTRKYKDSPNCRAEAEYAYKLRKPVIPLILERDYKPDGWLGMILGSKLFYDFSGKYQFESKVAELLKEVQQKLHRGKAGASATASSSITHHDMVDSPETLCYGLFSCFTLSSRTIVPVKQAPPPKLEEVIKSWSADQVKDWLKKYGLSGTRIEKLTGREIALLQKLQTSAPEQYCQMLKTDLDLKTITDMANFEKAMDELSQLMV